ncbi:MAG TPA: ribulose-phosphate 3-epimerase [Dysgonamonadaceae bacterium]|nr:ribulose-phosphate 3-epimerase [Dysgonamonadaceae bacterium]
MKSFYIAPSVMCVDLMNIERDIRKLENLAVDYLHVDIMDNHFVPNLMLPLSISSSFREISEIALDIHLMVSDPASCLDKLSLPRPNMNDIISIHYESTPHVQRVLDQIKKLGFKAGIALCPSTPIGVLEDLLPSIDMVLLMTVNPGFSGQSLVPGMIDKILRLKQYLIQREFDHILIEVDGNVNFEYGPLMYQNGADIFVVGTSSLFHHQDTLEKNHEKFIQLLNNTKRVFDES